MGNPLGKASEAETGNTRIFTISLSSKKQTKPSPTPSTSNLNKEDNATYTARRGCLQRERTREYFSTDKTAIDITSSNDEARFIVGDEKRMLIGQKSKMAAASDVFDAMLNGPWGNSNAVIEIPDISPKAMKLLIGLAEGASKVRLTEANVWDVLKAADKYQVLPLLHQCFTFLLHHHSARGKGHHICEVMELAHLLHQPEHQAACFDLARAKASDILSSDLCLSTLCYPCMLALVQADDLAGVDETLVHEAVITWSRYACARQVASSNRNSDSTECGMDAGLVGVEMDDCDGRLNYEYTDEKGCCNHAFTEEEEGEGDEEETEDREGEKDGEDYEGDRKQQQNQQRRRQQHFPPSPPLQQQQQQQQTRRALQGSKQATCKGKTDSAAGEMCPQSANSQASPDPSWQELRAAAKDLVYHVRYLSMPRPALLSLLSAQSPDKPACLLTQAEKNALLTRSGSGFPDKIRRRRRVRGVPAGKESSSSCVKIVLEVCLYLLVLLVIAHILLFMLKL